MNIEKKLIKVGIVGPRPYVLGGHDPSGTIRKRLYHQIESIVNNLHKNDKIVIGLTGLSLGIEQDFARLCLEHKIDYNVYLSHDNQEQQWKDLPINITLEYNRLLAGCTNCISISDGNYSPKKHIQKQIKIMKDSDIIIVVSGSLPTKNEKIQNLLTEKRDNILLLNTHV